MKIGIVSFGDGRKRVTDQLFDETMEFQDNIIQWFQNEGHEAIGYGKVVYNYAGAREAAGLFEENDCDIVVFNYSVWSYPDFSVQCAQRVRVPILQIGNINPGYPGWVAFFCAAGSLDEVGIPYGRVLGDIDDPSVGAQVREFLARHEPQKRRTGYEAADELWGMRYGEFDGPSMGMYTGHVDASQWMEQLGVNVHHRSQLTLYQEAKRIDDDRVEAGLNWLEDVCGEIQYDGNMLTPGLDGTLARQVRWYLAMKDFCAEYGIDFAGLTGQLDMTEYEDGMTADLAEALLNDIADWENESKDPIITATECDSNGALTMQLLHLISGDPVLFADLRHYIKEIDGYDLCNSGQHSPWLAGRSDDYRENWKHVTLTPASEFYFKCGGASVHFFAKPADPVTFARITRYRGQFRCHMFTGAFMDLAREKEQDFGSDTSPEWPHVFARFDCDFDDFVDQFSCNHIHAAVGNWLGEMKAACEALDIKPIVMS